MRKELMRWIAAANLVLIAAGASSIAFAHPGGGGGHGSRGAGGHFNGGGRRHSLLGNCEGDAERRTND
jgi:hypothetical protein